MDRRSLLKGLGAFAVAQGALGCSNAQQAQLSVHLLRGAIPGQLLNQFKSRLKDQAQLNLVAEPEIAALFKQLQAWQQEAKTQPAGSKSPTHRPATLVSLGDYWLAEAIRQGLIQPWPELPQWGQLPPRWQTLVKRDRQGNFSPTGQIWGAPYRWGMTVIAYRKDKFRNLGWQPTDWQDLWRPELKQRFSLLDHPREVIGLTLKTLKQSYSTENLEAVTDLKQQLIALNQQTKFYSSNAYLQPLVLGDTWAAVGWSNEVLSLMRRNQEISAIAPLSGTALWADLWVQQKDNQKTEAKSTQTTQPIEPLLSQLTRQWIDFWWQPEIANQLSQFSSGVSPIITPAQPSSPAKRLLLANASVFDRSEFLQPLSQQAIADWRSLWVEIRQTVA
ncbi:MAG: extracellular solute-binding protein [Aphanocapsa sp. GSE-SYN-MK-11-07L]|jgi:putative spermidine/putrescine transport system substrate-binding protein|nr:extracellular solute-binding protein [Aphanocapsa sp. GSE-SYN-MK-11-07L]